jgi:hypothetical protein
VATFTAGRGPSSSASASGSCSDPASRRNTTGLRRSAASCRCRRPVRACASRRTYGTSSCAWRRTWCKCRRRRRAWGVCGGGWVGAVGRGIFFCRRRTGSSRRVMKWCPALSAVEDLLRALPLRALAPTRLRGAIRPAAREHWWPPGGSRRIEQPAMTRGVPRGDFRTPRHDAMSFSFASSNCTTFVL